VLSQTGEKTSKIILKNEILRTEAIRLKNKPTLTDSRIIDANR